MNPNKFSTMLGNQSYYYENGKLYKIIWNRGFGKMELIQSCDYETAWKIIKETSGEKK